MPSTMLPTPAPSTEIEGKRASFSHGQIDAAFALPPAAIAAAVAALDARSDASPSSSSTTSNGSDSSYRPLSPQRSGLPVTANTTTASTASNPVKPSAGTRRRSSAANSKQNTLISPAPQPNSVETGQMYSMGQSYTLPPPPTRSRKIIQMKPRAQDGPPDASTTSNVDSASQASSTKSAIAPPPPTQASKKGSVSSATSLAAESTPAIPASSSAGTKRKQQAGPTTAAGRKIARKTAHSLIERRRRSKMNEEFAVLKDMIPACEGQDMHKLQVLSASIEYMRYLEQCLADLKTAHARCPPHSQDMASSHSLMYNRPPSSQVVSPPSQPYHFTPSQQNQSPDHPEDSDMSDADTATSPQSSLPPSIAPRPMHASAYASHAPSVSPAIMPSAHVSPALNASQQRGSYSQLYSMLGAAATVSTPYQYPGSAYSSQHQSPAFMPQVYPGSSSTQASGYGAFRLNSPAISDGPSRGEFGSISGAASGPTYPSSGVSGGTIEGKGRLETPDKEATAALMMLNTDRRSWSAGAAQDAESAAPSSARSARGMSVRDLLSN